MAGKFAARFWAGDTSVVLRAISEFAVEVDQLDNDSTSISVHGVYSDALGRVCGSAR